jgi:hypothetical protein
MSTPAFRTPVLISVIAAVSLVGGYVYVVWQRLRGGVTHLGEDTIALVYLSLLAALVVSAYCWLRRREWRRDWLAMLAVGTPAGVLAAWLYLNLSGSVIGYTEWIRRTKNEPNQTVQGTGASRSAGETNQTSGAAGSRP